ncbi:MAG TPA: DUF2167 domain-containing protein [Candidatus Polarisedimenticolia bacterium]|nr:DUF2167 domain-containing protein [Candidatus Polarisedimenticolia bacterium]
MRPSRIAPWSFAFLAAAGVAAALLTALPASAQEEPDPINWQPGPMTADLGEIAQIAVPAGYVFADAGEARRLLELMGNPTSGIELGVVMPDTPEGQTPWFVFFEFDPVGYVKDDEKEDLDAPALLASIREGNDKANAFRKDRGWSTLDITGWEVPPFYNEQTNNLEWAIRGSSEGDGVVNYSTRLLGRKGVMSVDLVLSPEQLAAAKPAYQALLPGFSYKSGERYAEFRSGDKIAAYGLTALVAGGAGAMAAKSGLLAKFWKVIVAGLVALGAGFKKILGLFRRGEQTAGSTPGATA